MRNHIGFRDIPEDGNTGRLLQKAVARLQFTKSFFDLEISNLKISNKHIIYLKIINLKIINRKMQSVITISVRAAVTLCTSASDRTANILYPLYHIHQQTNRISSTSCINFDPLFLWDMHRCSSIINQRFCIFN